MLSGILIIVHMSNRVDPDKAQWFVILGKGSQVIMAQSYTFFNGHLLVWVTELWSFRFRIFACNVET